jgi:hypothetical protein
MPGDQLTECVGCHKATPTINGRCPNCWAPKTRAGVVPSNRHYASVFTFDVEDPFLWTWLPVPIGLILLVLGLVLDAPVLLVIGGGMVALRFAGAVLPWDTW